MRVTEKKEFNSYFFHIEILLKHHFEDTRKIFVTVLMNITRMHSSRMRTARCSGRPWGWGWWR